MRKSDSNKQNIDTARRGFLKLSTGSAIALATVGALASVTGYTGFRWHKQSNAQTVNDFQVLRPQDLALFGALLPVILGPNPSFQASMAESVEEQTPVVITNTLQQLDTMLAYSSPAMQKQIHDLVDLLTFGATQGLVSGYWGDWQEASEQQINQFLQRWQGSSTQLFRFGYQGLCQLCQMAWYGRPESWADIGYPGPPDYLRGPHASS